MKLTVFTVMLMLSLTGLRAQTPGEMVFVHTDRDVYAPGDELKFCAYIQSQDPAAAGRLTLLLLDPAGKPVAESDFRIPEPVVPGEVNLPESLIDGEYRLIAFTTSMESGLPRDAYTRRLMVRKQEFPGLLVDLTTDEKWYVQGDRVELGVNISTLDRKPFGQSPFYYIATKNGIPYQNGIDQTDEAGHASLLVRVPATGEEGLILITVSAETEKLKGAAPILVPGGGMPVYLHFFPEGGRLINGQETRIGFRSVDFEGKPFDFAGVIMDTTGKIIDSISSTRYGIGSLRIRPDQSVPLRVKMTRPTGIVQEFTLPVVHPEGVGLTLSGRNEESLEYAVYRTGKLTGEALTAVASFRGRELARIPLPAGGTGSFEVPCGNLPGGIVDVRLVNGSGTVLAQRSAFIQPSKSTAISQPGITREGTPDPSKISLTLTSTAAASPTARLSISLSDAVMSPAWNTEPGIRQWFLLGSVAAALPPEFGSDPAAMDPELIDQLMLSLCDTFPAREGTSGSFRNRIVAHFEPDGMEQYVAKFRSERFFVQYMLPAGPGLPAFIKNNTAGLQEMGLIPGKPTPADRIRQQLETGVSILSVIRSIKPYTLSNNQIYFSKGKNSLEFPKGALFIIDGAEKGYNIDVLNYPSPTDIANIKVSDKISEILQYSADAGALILITTRKSSDASGKAEEKPEKVYDPTLYWNPAIEATYGQPAPLPVSRPALKSVWQLVLCGTDGKGNYFQWRQ